MIIAIDFDGTCVTHAYPAVGRDIGAAKVIRKITEKGHKIILYTMRSGESLKDAENWFFENDIHLFGVNANPEQHTWTSSPKPYANLYIDDAALGAPLDYDYETRRPYIDWYEVEEFLYSKGII